MRLQAVDAAADRAVALLVLNGPVEADAVQRIALAAGEPIVAHLGHDDFDLEGLKDAADEDRGTGGVDLERNIYPTIKTCTAGGIETIPDDEIARLHRDVIERRRRPVEA